MVKDRKIQFLFLVVFLLSCLLRLALVVFNRQANDPHWQVADIILQLHNFPLKNDCWECFQPKLFHLVFAAALQVSGWYKNSANQQNLVGEIVNFPAGVITLIVVWAFINHLPSQKGWLKLLAFALVAFNPALIGIGAQATNDAFAILFSTLALYFAYRFIEQPKAIPFALALVSLLLGISSKTNVWVTAVAIVIALLIKTLVQKGQRIKNASYAFSFVLIVTAVSIWNPLNQYRVNYRLYGSPVLLNKKTKPLPPFFGKGGTSGIWSIQDGLFTFKLGQLLEHPRLEQNPPKISDYQTSLWTVLYGRAHSIHFENARPTWVTSGPTLFPLTRGILILALSPTILIFVGAALESFWIIRGLIRKDAYQVQTIFFGLFLLTFVGYLLFEILYTLEIQAVTVLKVIFVYPALLTFPYLFLQAGERLFSTFDKFSMIHKWKGWLVSSIEIGIGILLVLYVVDVVTLILQLAKVVHF